MTGLSEGGTPRKKQPFVVWAAGLILLGAFVWALGNLPGGGSGGGLKRISSKEEYYSYLSSLKGKVVLVNFWATWCGPCRIEIPSFVEAQSRRKKDFVIVAVSMDQNPDEVLPEFVAKMGMNFPVLYGPPMVMQELGQDYGGIMGIPTSILLDRQGNTYTRKVGVYPPEQLEADLKGLLEKSAT